MIAPLMLVMSVAGTVALTASADDTYPTNIKANILLRDVNHDGKIDTIDDAMTALRRAACGA